MNHEGLIEVHLVGIPVGLWQRASSHQEALQREFELIRSSEVAESVPPRLLELIDTFNDTDLVGGGIGPSDKPRFGDTKESPWEELRAAAEAGAASKDLTFRVPAAVAKAARELKTMMTEVDAYCLSGDLLTVATPTQLVAFREWVLDEFINQTELGQTPTSWDQLSLAPVVRDGSKIVFHGALDLATAGALRDAIQERHSRGVRQLVLDLTNVGFVDSIGIGLLVTTHNRLDEDGATMRLIAPRRLQELLRLSGLTDILKPEDPS